MILFSECFHINVCTQTSQSPYEVTLCHIILTFNSLKLVTDKVNIINTHKFPRFLTLNFFLYDCTRYKHLCLISMASGVSDTLRSLLVILILYVSFTQQTLAYS